MARVAVRDGLFEPIDEPTALHLIGGLCGACKRRHFPAQATCPYCGAGGCQPTALSRSGTVHLVTTITSRPPGYDGPVPYGFGVVELEDSVRLISRIIEPERACPGTSVELTLEPIGSDEHGREVVIYAFKPIPADNQQPVTSNQ